MTSWFNVFNSNKTTEADVQHGATYSRTRAAQPQAEGYRDQYQPQYQQPYAYQQQLVEVPRPEATRPPPPPPQEKIDLNKDVRKAVAEIRKVKREYCMDDMRWRAQAKEYMAQERTEEAEELIESLIDSKQFQQQLDRNIIMVEKAARFARTQAAVTKVYSMIESVVKTANQGAQVDIVQISQDQLEMQQRLTETMDEQRMTTRMQAEQNGGRVDAARKRIKDSIINDLRNDLGIMPAPAAAQPQVAQPAHEALLAQLS